MDLHGFAPIGEFRVRLPIALFPYQGKQRIQACYRSELHGKIDGWIGVNQLGELFPASFSDRNRLNIPGPIYGAETDTCTTGPAEAPKNVLLDENGQEFIFKQPSNPVEFRDVVSAAICECFQGYGADGDSHWRLTSIREWWKDRGEMCACVHQEFGDSESHLKWKDGLNGAFAPYLQVYAFYVENGRVPDELDVLPELE